MDRERELIGAVAHLIVEYEPGTEVMELLTDLLGGSRDRLQRIRLDFDDETTFSRGLTSLAGLVRVAVDDLGVARDLWDLVTMVGENAPPEAAGDSAELRRRRAGEEAVARVLGTEAAHTRVSRLRDPAPERTRRTADRRTPPAARPQLGVEDAHRAYQPGHRPRVEADGSAPPPAQDPLGEKLGRLEQQRPWVVEASVRVPSYYRHEEKLRRLERQALEDDTRSPLDAVDDPVHTTHNDVSGGTVQSLVQTGPVGALHVHAAPGAEPDLRPVAALDRFALGAHPVRRFKGEGEFTAYVHRDADTELGELVADRESALVLVTGEPLAGKTTTAWAALRARLREASVHAPSPGADLRELPARLRGREGRTVLWLDDLERYLDDPGLDPALLNQLAALGVLTLATMSDGAYDRHRFGGATTVSRLLGMARTVEVGADWSPAELARLADEDEPRLREAARHRGATSVPQYLAVGPELWAEWRRACLPRNRPHGYALVRAAIDLGRCGVSDGVPAEKLRALSERYGDGLPGTFDDALDWAAATRHGTTGLLVSDAPGDSGAGTWRAYGSLVADALASGQTEPIHDSARFVALGILTGPARERCREAIRAVFLPRAEAGDLDAMLLLSEVYADDREESMRWLVAMADAGDVETAEFLGEELYQNGETTRAIAYLEAAAEGGGRHAPGALGRLHLDQARLWLGRAAESGDLYAAEALLSLPPEEETPAPRRPPRRPGPASGA
ncbi:hypothetical protein ACFVIM_20040 [Streptomyces sp. NPDC057638]|uniref:hypothetical protein n=1 Tax=Streptomyces sp. NPDC057638 TaxID=3346190 RepID=UPI00368E6F7B